ncbi:aromatic acid exporter family protein, partial [Staphylococcus warneri]|uniref:aromatic acid exporter family protein n=1 Tax=Staphylococcus warneri TaxID=1292 RepID=UPI0034D9707C
MVTIFTHNFIIIPLTLILLIPILFTFNLTHLPTLATLTPLIIIPQHTPSFYLPPFFTFLLLIIPLLTSSIVNFLF